jgi:hypothetical protein
VSPFSKEIIVHIETLGIPEKNGVTNCCGKIVAKDQQKSLTLLSRALKLTPQAENRKT